MSVGGFKVVIFPPLYAGSNDTVDSISGSFRFEFLLGKWLCWDIVVVE